jgi:hypothetical protein
LRRTSLIILLSIGVSGVHAEIYKCEDADGNLEYRQTPCPAAKPLASEAPPAEEAAVVIEERQPLPLRSDEEVEACKSPLRDQIDEIEAEMLRGYAADDAEQFKQRLRVLTEAMRDCAYVDEASTQETIGE